MTKTVYAPQANDDAHALREAVESACDGREPVDAPQVFAELRRRLAAKTR